MKYQISKKITTIFLVLALIVSVVSAATLWQEKGAASIPEYEKEDISAIAAKETWTEADYKLLWEQTGLGKPILEKLQSNGEKKEILLREQTQLFDAPDHICTGLTLFSKAEMIGGTENHYTLYDLQPGDVLITKSTHTLFYRHGHSALYLGNGEILEAAAIGMPTDTTEASYWGKYPSGIHLRLKEDAAKAAGLDHTTAGAQAAEYAKKELNGDKYHLLAGAFGIGTETDNTQCAHLIYAAYEACGIDVSSRSFPITPKSLLESGQFEILRCWGFNPKDLHW